MPLAVARVVVKVLVTQLVEVPLQLVAIGVVVIEHALVLLEAVVPSLRRRPYQSDKKPTEPGVRLQPHATDDN